MIENINPEELARIDEALREGDVFAARRGVPGGVVMEEQKRCGNFTSFPRAFLPQPWFSDPELALRQAHLAALPTVPTDLRALLAGVLLARDPPRRQLQDRFDRRAARIVDPVVSKNTNELKTRVSQGVSDRRVYAWFAKGS